jgi:hypothetical protein
MPSALPSSPPILRPRLVNLLGWASLAFWIHYAVLRQVAGPLNVDEVYFSHTLWLLNQGKRQYVDFYSNHLPAYFRLLEPLVAAISRTPSDLSFLWGVRWVSAGIIAGYLALAWTLGRQPAAHRGRAALVTTAPLLLAFLVFARMVEIRTDTFGLLLVNVAWALVLCSRSTRAMTIAALLAGLSLLFSARAAGMAGVMGLLLLYLAARVKDRRTVRALLLVAAAFVGAGMLLLVLAPDWTMLVIRSCFLEPTKLLNNAFPLARRFVAPERIPLAILLVAGLLSGLRMLQQRDAARGLIVTVACGAQLLIIVFDPAPYEYVYGWAAVPAVFGIARVSRAFALGFPVSVAAVLVGGAIAIGLATGQPPATASYFRLTYDATLAQRDIAQMPTAELVALLVNDRGQKNLTNQLRVRSEVCRRLQGTVLTTFDTHPICLDDALFYWTGVRWPPLVEGDAAPREAMSQEEFARVFLRARPRLFIWEHRWDPARKPLDATRRMLACCYDVQPGFALARDSASTSSQVAGPAAYTATQGGR